MFPISQAPQEEGVFHHVYPPLCIAAHVGRAPLTWGPGGVSFFRVWEEAGQDATQNGKLLY